MRTSKALRAALASLLVAAGAPALAAVQIIINNNDGPGVGFNDPTPVLPVGGNTGTTLGQQRLNAFTYAANLWGATLTSSVPIVINATFEPLNCTANSAVLGSAGATAVFSDFPGAPRSGTWYSFALANKLAGTNLDPTSAQIRARFNVRLGQPDCLPGPGWYYGLDGNEGAGTDFVAVLLHEMGHGLGFQTFTSGQSGAPFLGIPSAWDHYLLDTTTGKTWVNSTDAERAASAISVNNLVWNGSNVTAAAPTVLKVGLPGVAISGTASGPLNGTTLLAGEASFGPALTNAGVSGQVMPVVTPTAGGSACGPLTVNDARAVAGRIALVDRGACNFTVKVKNAQNAGAIGVLVADNAAGSPPPGLGGSDPTVTIPAVRITLADGNALKAQLATRSRTGSGVIARIGLVGTSIAGADASGRVKMYAPSTFSGGSSVSHYDTTASRNQLMEPAINSDLTQSVQPPQDLTLPLFRDIGW